MMAELNCRDCREYDTAKMFTSIGAAFSGTPTPHRKTGGRSEP